MLSQADGVAAIELNISCPNIKEGGIQFGCSLTGTYDVVSAVKKATHLPVIPKLTPNVTDVASFARAAEDAGADAVSLVNTFLAMAIDVETRRPKITNVMGGLSGPAIRPIAVRMVWECYQLGEDSRSSAWAASPTRAMRSSSCSPAPPRCRSARRISSTRSCGRRCSTGCSDYMTRHNVAKLSDLIGAFDPDAAKSRPRMNPILVALDVESAAKAVALADALRGSVGGFKIGKQLFTAAGPAMVRELTEPRRSRLPRPEVPRHSQHGRRRGAVGGCDRRVDGQRPRLRRQRDDEGGGRSGGARPPRTLGRPRPLVIGVTVLTSMDDAGARGNRRGHGRCSSRSCTSRSWRKASGLDGVVASPQEIAAIRAACGPDFQIVTPGIRPADQQGKDDQARTLTPAEAMAAGAIIPGDRPPHHGGAQSREAAETNLGYFAVMMKWPRRFCCQQASFDSRCRRALPCPC